ncbi:MAG: hydroxyacylglutathione hydrolase [Gammaproteobacteria bacterium]|jgi:hydroxyacylglutathione hydrolase
MIEVIPVPAFQDNYIWLLHNTSLGNVAIVDPGEAEPVIATLEALNLHPVAILITHHHADHVGGVNKLLSHHKIPVYGPSGEKIPGLTNPLKESDIVEINNLQAKFTILDVPGHTLGHIAYYGHDKLFIGDTLFMSGCGRLFEGTAAQMYNSLEKLKALPDTTNIYCGHEYTIANLGFAKTVEPENSDIKKRLISCQHARDKNIPTVPGTLKIEKKTNPFLRSQIPEVIAAAETYAGHKLSNSAEVFASIRRWKDNF